MDVLILSGELLTQRPLTYGASGDRVATIEVGNPQLRALVDKFENPTSIPVEELAPAIKLACAQVLAALDEHEPDVVVATEFAGDVLAILRSRGTWSGAAVIINPIGFYRSYPRVFKRHQGDPERPPAECMWVTTHDVAASSKAGPRVQGARGRGTMSVQVGSLETLYRTKLLDGCISAVVSGDRR